MYVHELSASFFENTEACGVCKNKENDDWSKIFLVKGWNIESRIPKVAERIIMNIGLLILHKTKVLILW